MGKQETEIVERWIGVNEKIRNEENNEVCMMSKNKSTDLLPNATTTMENSQGPDLEIHEIFENNKKYLVVVDKNHKNFVKSNITDENIQPAGLKNGKIHEENFRENDFTKKVEAETWIDNFGCKRSI